jgi:hypothetical protein
MESSSPIIAKISKKAKAWLLENSKYIWETDWTY